MKGLLAWVVLWSVACLPGLAGCSGGCGCGGGEQKERLAQKRVKIPSKKPVFKAKPVHKKPENANQPAPVKDLGLLRVGEATAPGDDLAKRLNKVPATPGAALTVSGAPAPTEVELNQPHLQGFKPGTRAAIITATKAQSTLPPPKEPEEGAVEVNEEEYVKKQRRRRRSRRK